MNTSKKLAALAAATTLLLGAAPAFAETSLQGSANAVINAVAQGYGISGNASANADVDANVNANNAASGSNGLGASIKAMLDGATDDEATSSPNASGTTTTRGSEQGAMVRITRADVDNNGATGVSITLPAQVKTSADLSSYVSSTVKADENVQAVESASDKVSLTYKQHAKFLGFIPVTLNATADVDAAGNVTVRYPWYAIFAVTDKADLEGKVQQSVNATLGVSGSAEGDANGTASLSAEAQAQVVAAVRAAMEDAFTSTQDAAGSASGTVEAGADVSGDASVQ
jgi:hypothetical protein